MRVHLTRPAPPKPPPGRLIYQGFFNPVLFCEVCGSSMMIRKFIVFGKPPGCMQKECENYGGKKV